MAVWAVGRLVPEAVGALAADRRETEIDEHVRAEWERAVSHSLPAFGCPSSAEPERAEAPR